MFQKRPNLVENNDRTDLVRSVNTLHSLVFHKNYIIGKVLTAMHFVRDFVCLNRNCFLILFARSSSMSSLIFSTTAFYLRIHQARE